jgi:hypothetical protein
MKKALLFIISITLIIAAACSPAAQQVAQAMSVTQSLPQVTLFTGDPTKIENGSTVTLKWQVKNADSVEIDNGIGRVPATGSIEVKPKQITAYNLTAVNEIGSASSAVIVNVRPFIKLASPTNEPTQSSHALTASMLPRLAADESYVFFNNAVMVGADEHYIVLRNNPAAKNPTWKELKDFLLADHTERNAYVPGKFTCGDFAEMLHNNAEAAGIRAAIVAIELSQPGVGLGTMNHSLNAFDTTDRGIMYIDDTASSQGYYADKEANVKVGDEYICESIFPKTGLVTTWASMGTITAIDIYQW